MDSQRRAFKVALLLGIILFPPLFILDATVYPEHKTILWSIRAVMTFSLLAIRVFLINYIKDKYLFLMTFLCFFTASFAITLMCFISGDGLASTYYAGQFIVIIIATVFSPMKKNYYSAIVASCMAQHFIMLSFLPWDVEDLLKNIFFLGAVSLSGLFVRNFIYNLVKEIKTLRGFIPICAKCKKVRDDKGFWQQVENYIRDRADVEFTHGLCPECAKEFEEKFMEYKKKRGNSQNYG